MWAIVAVQGQLVEAESARLPADVLKNQFRAGTHGGLDLARVEAVDRNPMAFRT